MVGAPPPLGMAAYSSLLLEGAPSGAAAAAGSPPGAPRISPEERLQLVSELPVQYEGEVSFKPRASRLHTSRKRWAQLRGRTTLLVFRDGAAAAAATGRGRSIDSAGLEAVYDLGTATVECMQKKGAWRIWLRPRSEPGESLFELPLLGTDAGWGSLDGDSAGGSMSSISSLTRGGDGSATSARDMWESQAGSSQLDSAASSPLGGGATGGGPSLASPTLVPVRSGPIRSGRGGGGSPAPSRPRGAAASPPCRIVQSAAPSSLDAVFKLRNATEFTAWSTVLTRAAALSTPCLDDFEVGEPIGAGGGGRVYTVRPMGSGTPLAMKVVAKRGVLFNTSTLRNAVNERLALERTAAGHPFLLPLRYAFQTPDHMFLVTELCEAGDLATYLQAQPQQRCEEDDVRFLAAELILALEHIHAQDVVFRDMKPENVLLDRDGHVRVADFGLARFLPSADGCANSLCGTPSFLPPEMLNGKPYGIPADMWSLGVCLYRCLTGELPWGKVGRASATFRSIKSDAVHFPPHLHPVTVSFLQGLLERRVPRRLTIAAAKAHPFLATIDWEEILSGNGPGLDVRATHTPARFRRFEAGRDGPLPDFLGGTPSWSADLDSPPRPPASPPSEDPLAFEGDPEGDFEDGEGGQVPMAAVARKLFLCEVGTPDGLAATALGLNRPPGPGGPQPDAPPALPGVRIDRAGGRVAAPALASSLATTIVGYEYSADRPLASSGGLSVAFVHRKSSAVILLSKLSSIRSL